jgi:hypothetical protein
MSQQYAHNERSHLPRHIRNAREAIPCQQQPLRVALLFLSRQLLRQLLLDLFIICSAHRHQR